MAVFVFAKFWICFQKMNISFKPEFGHPRFETLEKQNVFQFWINFAPQQLLILLVGSVQASAEKPGILNLFLSSFFLYTQQQKKVIKSSFSKLGF